MPRPHWRKMTWALIVWTTFIVIWAVTGGASNNCGSKATTLNQNACEAGTGIGVAIILLIGFFGFVTLGLIWFMSRPKGRDCPVCGELVKKGETTCTECGYDFATSAGQPAVAATSTGVAPAQVAAGWFPDPMKQAMERYWDGGHWTGQVRGDVPVT